MADARPNPFDFDVTKMFADFRFHPFDVEAVWAAQRRNIEALSQANQAAMAGVQALARHQIELTRETFEGFSALMRDIAQPGSSDDRVAKNTDYVKQVLENGVKYVLVSHNTKMGAAKGCVLAAEVLASDGYIG